MWDWWDMLWLGVWYALSTASAGAASQSLRKATIPVSDELINGFDLFISFLPLYSTAYSFDHLILFQVASEMEYDPSYIDLRNFIQDNYKHLLGLAICKAMVQYCFDFSVYWISFLAVCLGSMEIDQVHDDFYIPSDKLHWLSVVVLLFSRNVLLKIMMLLIPYYYHVLVTPYFIGLTSRSSLAARAYEQRKYIEIVCGMLANALSTYYFRFQSMDLMLALLGSAVSFLYMFATVKPSTDFGIMQFLLTQSIQCAVTLFGLLHFKTLLVLVFGCLILVFRWKLESVQLLKLKSWRGKCWLNYRTIQIQNATLFAGQDLLLAAFQNYHPLLIWGPSALLLIVFMRFIVSGPREKIYRSIWQWYWHRIGNLSAPLYYYVHFREILHLMLPYFHHSKYDLHGDPIPPV
ncbi:OLC1v1023089C1 [Oldenlandia corymbosa var. corymbosa]|uniref:OLC1v1023089C1 n=1 Tax=Oldenlandia corymbosa var. corymbosa TaxID=529605 RepID=A0AAV1BZM7_OLDCO|nr:OLC1v1023089C1 [Oldenlandia corymbosa var. corymbosa]